MTGGIVSLRRLTKWGERERNQMTGNIAAPTIQFFIRDNFPVPEVGADGLPTGNIVFAKRVVAAWPYLHENVGWDFMYRVNDEGLWLKPAVVSSSREIGTGRLLKAMFLDYREDYDTAYEFLPLVTLNPRAK